MNKAQVSIIIPVYNMERYLRDCVDSVLKQSYPNYEIILVDDGSNDSSPQICDELSNYDKRIHVIHQNNGGLSVARNEGLARAQGDYILFLDSDDFWICENDLEDLMDFAETQKSDFTYIEFNRSRYYPSSGTYVQCPVFPSELEVGNSPESVIRILVNYGIFPMSACTKLMKRDFLIDNGIKFIKGIYSEDIPWFLDILRKAQRPIFYYNKYIYGNRAEVITSLTSTFSVSKFEDVVNIIDHQVQQINEDRWADDVKQSLFSFLAYRYCILMGLYATNKKSIPNDLVKRTIELRYLLNYDIHPKVKRVRRLYNLVGFYFTSWVLGFFMMYKGRFKRSLKKKS